MSKSLELNQYKQSIADFYDQRSDRYDLGEWRQLICQRLLEYASIKQSQTVLDIGTGTGQIAIAIAEIVGDQGKVIGVDISPKMLEQANHKVKLLGLNNLEFKLQDGESLQYPLNFFDHILCAHTFPWLENKADTLSLWHGLLKSGGGIGVHTPGDTAYIGQVLFYKVFARYGIFLKASNRLGSIEQCKNLFEQAGFTAIEIKTESHSSYTTLAKEKASWAGRIGNPGSIFSQINHQQLTKLPQSQLLQIEAEYYAELEALETDQGIWDEIPTWYVLGRKP